MAPLALVLALALPAAAQAPKKTVLVVGDSHTAGVFGRTLDDELRAREDLQVATFGICASTARWFLRGGDQTWCGALLRGLDKAEPPKFTVKQTKTIKYEGGEKEVVFHKNPKLADLLAEYKPRYVIVALGSNGVADKDVEEILIALQGAHAGCFWVGPPDMRTQPRGETERYVATIRSHMTDEAAATDQDLERSCAFINSANFQYLRYPAKGGDGTHYGKYKDADLSPLARKWAEDVFALVSKRIPK